MIGRRKTADEATVLDDIAHGGALIAVEHRYADALKVAEALREEVQQQTIRAEMAEQERDELRAAVLEWKQAAGAEADHADDLSTRSLPSLPGAVFTAARPVGALLCDALAEQTGIDPKPTEPYPLYALVGETGTEPVGVAE